MKQRAMPAIHVRSPRSDPGAAAAANGQTGRIVPAHDLSMFLRTLAAGHSTTPSFLLGVFAHVGSEGHGHSRSCACQERFR